MKKTMFIFAVTLALFGCKSDEQKAIDKTKDAFINVLFDSDSAKYKELSFYPIPTKSKNTLKGYVCGQVNAKNKFGAYTGYHKFYAEVGSITSITLEPDHLKDKLDIEKFWINFNKFCKNYSNEEYRKIASVFISNNESGTLILNDSGIATLVFSSEDKKRVSCDNNKDCFSNIIIDSQERFTNRIYQDKNNPEILVFQKPDSWLNYLKVADNVVITIPVSPDGEVAFTFDDKSHLR